MYSMLYWISASLNQSMAISYASLYLGDFLCYYEVTVSVRIFLSNASYFMSSDSFKCFKGQFKEWIWTIMAIPSLEKKTKFTFY